MIYNGLSYWRGREDMKQDFITLLKNLKSQINKGGIKELEENTFSIEVDDFYKGAESIIDMLVKELKDND